MRVLYYDPPDFKVPPGTAQLMMFGAIGGAVAAAAMTQSEGLELVNQYGVEDPIMLVKRRFIPSAGAMLKTDTQAEAIPRQDDEVDSLKKEFEQGYTWT